MKICEATTLRIKELRKEKRMTVYSLIYQSGMPASTVKSILSGKSKSTVIHNNEKIAERFGISIREFYNSELFDNLDPED